ncbi:OLC1v1013408C1 [Oldenlandia corymbosa var. corymbosa]|uniref:OLC1v1013408C1 n=1 Tax=Oldenlandia corymbosa var. corymbosa TaxID=529605 RepID=A0AAV1DYN0_OLDCO|nr:OLC1v1013408C1 [Oldenlandia corymbosa var. corymbosa]
MASLPILAIVSSLVEHVDSTVVRSVDNVLKMIGFPLPIAALADIVMMTGVTLSLIAQLADALLMTIATLEVTHVTAASIQTLPIIVVALAGFVPPFVALVELVHVVVGSVLQMDRLAQIALEMVESIEVALMAIVPATMAITASHSTALLSNRSVETPLMMIVTALEEKTMLVMTELAPMISEHVEILATMIQTVEYVPTIDSDSPLWTLSIAKVATAFETGLTVKSHEPIETPLVVNKMVGSLPRIAAELILETVSVAKPVGSVRMATEYPDTPSAMNMVGGHVPM